MNSLSDLRRNKTKHHNGRIKFLSQEIKNTAKYLQSLLTFLKIVFIMFMSFSQGDWLIC